ncbi:MAG: hypothetical protein ACOYOA_03750 [Saprospiraceae bacterium]
MKKSIFLSRIFTIVLLFSTFYVYSIPCEVTFTNPQVIFGATNKFRVTLTITSFSPDVWEFGNANLRFKYPANCLSNPTIAAYNLSGTGFSYSNPTTIGSSLLQGLMCYNLSLPVAQHGFVIPSTGYDIMTVEWTVTNLSALSDPANKLRWQKAGNPGIVNPYLAMVTSYQTQTVGCSGGCVLSPLTAPDLAPLYAGSVSVNVKAILSGCFDKTTLKMIDEPRTDLVMPLKEPFTQFGYQLKSGINASITDSLGVLSDHGDNSIVDWILLELRSKNNPAQLLASKPLLIQIDGDIVELNGVSTPTFTNMDADQYFVVVRHRNQLSARTAAPVALSSTVTNLNFTNNSILLNGSFPVTQVANGIYGLISGDANYDGSVDAAVSIIFEIENGLFHEYFMNADYNLDNSIDAFDTIQWVMNNGKYEEID